MQLTVRVEMVALSLVLSLMLSLILVLIPVPSLVLSLSLSLVLTLVTLTQMTRMRPKSPMTLSSVVKEVASVYDPVAVGQPRSDHPAYSSPTQHLPRKQN